MMKLEFEDCYDDLLEVLNSIKAYIPSTIMQTPQWLLPCSINRAKPSKVIIAYFTNYTDPLPEECSFGTYPWRTFLGIHYTYHNIDLYMWTTQLSTKLYISYNIIEYEGILHEFGQNMQTM